MNNAAQSPSLSTGGGGLGSSIEFNGVSVFKQNRPINGRVRLIGSSIYVYNSTLRILNTAHFSENSGTYSGAIEAVDSDILLHGQITFSDNCFGGTISIFRCNMTFAGEIIGHRSNCVKDAQYSTNLRWYHEAFSPITNENETAIDLNR